MKRILIIEDERDLREALQIKLSSEGFAVEAVETSEEGLMLVVADKPDLILLDVLTHSLHAQTFLQRLRELPNGQGDCKVIILTNLDNDITRKKVMQFGIEDFMVKSSVSLQEIADRAHLLLKE